MEIAGRRLSVTVLAPAGWAHPFALLGMDVLRHLIVTVDGPNQQIEIVEP